MDDLNLTLDELTAKYLGQRVLILYSCPDWTSAFNAPLDLERIAVVERVAPNSGGPNAQHQHQITVYHPYHKCGWGIALKDVELVDKIIAVPKIKLYPHTCKACKSNGRRIGKVFLCSNFKCKTRERFKAVYQSPKIIIKTNSGLTIDDPIEVLCSVCGEIVDDWIEVDVSSYIGWCICRGSFNNIYDSRRKVVISIDFKIGLYYRSKDTVYLYATNSDGNEWWSPVKKLVDAPI